VSATAKSVVERLNRLLTALQKLFASKSLETIVSIVARLGIDRVLVRGAQCLQGALERAQGWLDSLRAELAQTDALGGLIGVLSPVLRCIGELSSAAGTGLTKMGLGPLETVIDPAESFATMGQRVLDSTDRVLDQLPTAVQIDGLKKSVTDLLGSISELKGQVEQAALSAGGGVQ